MRKRLFIATISTILIAIVVALYTFRTSPESLSSETPDFILSSEAIATAFETNEATANASYLNKIVVVEGKVTEIDKTETDKTLIILEGSATASISSLFANNQLPNKLPQVGTIIKVKGKCNGFIFDVILTKCSIEK